MSFFSLTQCTKSYLDNCEIFSFFSEEIIPYVAIDCVSIASLAPEPTLLLENLSLIFIFRHVLIVLVHSVMSNSL